MAKAKKLEKLAGEIAEGCMVIPQPHRIGQQVGDAIRPLLEALQEVREALDDRSDIVDGSEEDGPSPNWAMRLGQVVEKALEGWEGGE